jgi:hypothetical protein
MAGTIHFHKPVFRIRDPGWLKIRIRIRDEQSGSYFRGLRNNFLVKKLLGFCDADPVSRMEKIRIRDGKKSDPG